MNLDTTTLVHVGTELVVLGAYTYWIQKKCAGLEARITELETQCRGYEDLLMNQTNVLKLHHQLLQQLTGGALPPLTTQASPQQAPGASGPQPQPAPRSQGPPAPLVAQQPPQVAPSQTPPPTPKAPKKGAPKRGPRKQKLTPEQLDALLQAELTAMGEEETTEIVIDDSPPSPPTGIPPHPELKKTSKSTMTHGS